MGLVVGKGRERGDEARRRGKNGGEERRGSWEERERERDWGAGQIEWAR